MGKKTTVQIGLKFGRWEVIDNNFIVRNTHRYVKCRCECGTELLVPSANLLRERTKSCKHCVALSRRIIIPTGAKSKNWTITGNTYINKHQNFLYEVQCDCGNTRWMTASEFYNKNKAILCKNCAAIERGKASKIKNGVVGDLDANKYGKIKRTAEHRNIEFNVSLEYLWELYENLNKLCAITNDPILDINKASLDRIDSSIGYIEGNVQWVTKQANLSKHVMSMEELYEFCTKVLNHANQQPSTPLKKCEGSETNS